jgi:hypothetical protein
MELEKTDQYEDFGAAGDGVTDDMRAICAAQDYANSQKLQDEPYYR